MAPSSTIRVNRLISRMPSTVMVGRRKASVSLNSASLKIENERPSRSDSSFWYSGLCVLRP